MGYLDSTQEFYFIFSDDYRSKIETKSAMADFKEIRTKGQIAKVQVQSIESSGYWDGVFTGIRFLDRKGTTLLEAGRIAKSGPEFFITEFELSKDERLLGVKSRLQERGLARHWNLEFIVGSK